MAPSRRVQLHITLPYKIEPVDDPVVRSHLERGYRIVQFQRLTDRDALVTLEAPAPASS